MASHVPSTERQRLEAASADIQKGIEDLASPLKILGIARQKQVIGKLREITESMDPHMQKLCEKNSRLHEDIVRQRKRLDDLEKNVDVLDAKLEEQERRHQEDRRNLQEQLDDIQRQLDAEEAVENIVARLQQSWQVYLGPGNSHSRAM